MCTFLSHLQNIVDDTFIRMMKISLINKKNKKGNKLRNTRGNR